jgi:1-acyl-sn-glycerol-3-phosphate acyltransferase
MILKPLRLIVSAIYVALISLISMSFCLLRPFKAENSHLAGRLLGAPVLWILGIQIRIENWIGLYNHRPCIFVSNHQSNVDLFLCGRWISPGTVSLGKKSIKMIPFFGMLYWLAGNIMIDRKNKKSAINTMDEAADIINKRGVSVWMMPEGTRYRKPGVKPFKKGPFYTAIKAGVPIVPVAFNRYSDDLDFNRWNSGYVLAQVFEPISTKELTLDDVEQLSQRCYKIIQEGVERLNQEAQDLYGQKVLQEIS